MMSLEKIRIMIAPFHALLIGLLLAFMLVVLMPSYAVIGLVVVALAQVIVRFVLSEAG